MSTEGFRSLLSRMGIAILVVIPLLMGLVGGIVFVTRPAEPLWHRAAGAGLLGGTTVILILTVQKWAKWFWGFCTFTTLKALAVFISGSSWTGPVARATSGLLLLLMGLILALAFKYVAKKPKTTFEMTGIVACVVAMAWMLVSNNLAPLAASTAWLATARISSGQAKRSATRHRLPIY